MLPAGHLAAFASLRGTAFLLSTYPAQLHHTINTWLNCVVHFESGAPGYHVLWPAPMHVCQLQRVVGMTNSW
eukprot:6476521-Amphidinium_carterae.2